ncbi:hypothetical protein [Nostoc sp.]|uniref:hypothetical protein n=1 Tax=Nostoc sp. TaxID=1180 RepID=UPI003FA52504
MPRPAERQTHRAPPHDPPRMIAIVVSLVYRQIPGLREMQRVLSRIGIVMGGSN